MTDIITLSISDFRAVNRAEIKLNGITVVSGINGCGKSTLSKFLYYSFKIANDYETFVNKYLSTRLDAIQGFVDVLYLDVMSKQTSGVEPYEYYKKFNGYHRRRAFSVNDKDALLSFIQILEREYTKILDNIEVESRGENKRIIAILQNVLNVAEGNFSFNELMAMLYHKIESYFIEVEMLLKTRPLSVLSDELLNIFEDSKLPKSFEIREYGDLIIGSKAKSVSIAHSVQKIAYIDTPMMMGINATNMVYWDDLQKVLSQNYGNRYNKSIDEIIRIEILKGESKLDSDESLNERFVFRRDNGAVFSLLECATGVKAFSILQIMLRNCFLTPNTLLIIDEPEAHLHPQWIVEYARLIVLLNKIIGVKFLIASHSPDMVSAIKYISEKEGTDSSLNYYLAEEVGSNKDMYTYKSLDTDIDPIFNSFNIGLDRISLYGISNNDNNDLF